MEFWGVEVKPGETVKCHPGEARYVHMSQVTLGETRKDKGNESILVFLKVKSQKLVLGTLSAEKCTQISYDLVFESEFELSHGSKNASVYFLGYKGADRDDTSDLSDSDSEEDIQLGQRANGKPDVKEEHSKPAMGKAAAEKPDAAAAKLKVKVDESRKADKLKDANDEDDEDSDDEDDGDDDDSEDVSDGDEDMAEPGNVSDEDDEDESSDEEDEDTPKAEIGKKRLAESGSRTPAPEKKAKLISPIGSQKTGGDGKKGHTATPHPAKRVGKMPAANDKSKQQTPKPSGSVSCKSCSRTFNSENALQAHTKAKHGTAK